MPSPRTKIHVDLFTAAFYSVLTMLALVTIVHTAYDYQSQQTQTEDIRDLESFRENTEDRLQGRWMKSDHDQFMDRLRAWAEEMDRRNPDIQVPPFP